MKERREQTHTQNPDAAFALRDKFLEAIDLPPGAIIAGYVAQNHEIDPLPLMQALHAKRFSLALPVVDARNEPLVFCAYTPGDALVTRNAPPVFLEPSSSSPLVVPDILLVPLLAFDRSGHRLGYGGGYYDRTLADLRRKKKIFAIGLGFSGQETAQLPAHSGDMRLDKIVTETGVFASP